jgi:electron transfer flavoprotein alpha subunit
MKDVFIISEVREEKIHPVTYELLAWGRELTDKLRGTLSALVLGNNLEEQLKELIFYGADKIEFFKHKELEVFNVENYTKILVPFIKEKNPEIILASATTQGRTLMPYLAGKLKTGLTADCTYLDIEEDTGLLLQVRPAIGGNVLATIKTPEHKPQMATIRPRNKKPLPRNEKRKGEIIVHNINEIFSPRVKRIDFKKREKEVSLSDVEIIIAGGKGLKNPQNFSLLFDIAHLLNGAVGASRSAVDMGWIEYPHQVGLSGKTVNPKVYIAVGISGAVQHLAGMINSENIIAINKDPEAPIFQVSDLGIVGDALEILPLLKKKLYERKKKDV